MRLGRAVGFAVFVLLALAMPQLVRYYTDWLWFSEVGFPQVFSTVLRSQSLLFAGAVLASVAWFALNVRIAVATMGERRPTFVTREGIEVQLPGREQVQRLALAAMTVIAVLIGLYAAGQWPLWLTFRHGGSFGQSDPILGFDVGFYVFSLLLAFGAWLRRAEHLLEPTTLLFGASYADVMGRMPASLLLVAVCVAGAGLAMLQAFTTRNWPIPAAVALYVAVSVGGEVYSS